MESTTTKGTKIPTPLSPRRHKRDTDTRHQQEVSIKEQTNSGSQTARLLLELNLVFYSNSQSKKQNKTTKHVDSRETSEPVSDSPPTAFSSTPPFQQTRRNLTSKALKSLQGASALRSKNLMFQPPDWCLTAMGGWSLVGDANDRRNNCC